MKLFFVALHGLLVAHRSKSQSPEFTVGIDARRTVADKRSRPNLQRMTPKQTFECLWQTAIGCNVARYLLTDPP